MATAAMLPPPRWTLPPIETGGQIFARLAYLVEPREKLTVSAWARKHTRFDLGALPWHVEVMDALSDPATAEVGLLGPAQAGKSTIGLSWIGWCVDQQPDNFFLCQPSPAATGKFVVTRIDPFIAETKCVRSKLLPLTNANNMHLKQFQGMFLYNVWPVPGQFIQVPARYGWLDDFDQMDNDIGGTADKAGQGSAIALVEGRLTTRKGRDTKFISSSPADETGGKTEAFVAGGTMERLWPECPSCGERWQIDIRNDLQFDDTGTEDQAEASAHVVCANGCVLAPSDRRALLNSLMKLPNAGFIAQNPAASSRRRTFWPDGLLCFTSWPDLARSKRAAQIEWHLRQDEGPLRTHVNTKEGYNFRSLLSGEKPLSESELAKRREADWKIGTVPAWCRVIVVLVDAQHNGFQCAAVGFGEGLEWGIIDRWSIDVTDRGIPLAPFVNSEHAEVLAPLWSMTWPLADGSGQSPPPLSVTIDTGGGGTREDGWTAAVQNLWHKATASVDRGGWGIARARITLVKGGNNPNGRDLMPPAKFADRKIRGGAKRRSPDLWMPNVHRIKNIVDARLRRAAPGPGYLHIPGADGPRSRPRDRLDKVRGLEDEHLAEITAEELQKGRWKKIRPRNETLDHLVYAIATLLKPPFAQSRTHMRWVPATYRVREQAGSLPLSGAQNGVETPQKVAGTPADPVKPAQIEPKAQPAARRSAHRPAKPWIPNKKGGWLPPRR